jgi:hypothetical protein
MDLRSLAGRPLSAGSSKGWVLAGILVVVLAAAIGRNRNVILLASFAVLTIYSIVDPLLVAGRSGPWPRLAMVSVAGWMVLFILGAGVSQTMGSDAMVFLFPMMVFPVALLLGGLVRLVRGRTRKVP